MKIIITAQVPQLTRPARLPVLPGFHAAAAGTAMTAGATFDVVAGQLWGSFMLCVTTGSGFTVVPSAAVNHATEALAIADMVTVGKTANSAVLGYVTIQSTTAILWDSTTDRLPGGVATGTAPNAGNYYEGYGIMINGITPMGADTGDTYKGFQIGTSAHLNILNGSIRWKAYRS